MDATEQLATRVQALPSELFNRILDFVLEPPTGVVKITKKYRPPRALQINRSSRKEVAAHYYGGNTIFEFDTDYEQYHIAEPGQPYRPGGQKTASPPPFQYLLAFIEWLASLTTEHQQLIQRIQYVVPCFWHVEHEADRVVFAMQGLRGVQRELLRKGISVDSSAVYTSVLVEPNRKTATRQWMNLADFVAKVRAGLGCF